MKNARGHILLLHQKGSSPLGLQPVNKCYFQKSSLQREFQSLLDAESSGFRELLLGIRNSWCVNGFLGRGLLRPDGEKCEPSSLYFPIPKPTESIFQSSKKHLSKSPGSIFNPPKSIIQPSKKYLSSLQETSFIPSQKYLSHLKKASFKSPESIFKSFQQPYSKSPESKLQASRNPFNPNHQES